jgi:hypothetical protein
LSTSTWLKEKRSLALTASQHYNGGNINEEKDEEDREK